jgi:hypothetical protein
MRFIFLFLLCSLQLSAQQYLSKEGYVRFFSEAPMENIEAENHQVAGVIDLPSGEFAFRLKIEDFQFENALMQEHFNENYLESDLYPLSTFTGMIEGLGDLDLSNQQEVEVTGEMLMHGVKQMLTLTATISMKSEELELTANFPIRLVDYQIEIPKLVFYNIAEVVDVSIQMNLSKLK